MKTGRLLFFLTLILAVFECLMSTPPLSKSIISAEENSEKKLPVLTISLNGTTLEEINHGDKETKYPGNEVAFLIDDNTFNFSNVQIKGRGNSTWGQNKKPYNIKLGAKENLFGMGSAKDWVLLANNFDPSSLRNDVAYFVSDILFEGNKMTPGEFVELYVDDEYVGLYYLTHKVEIDKTVINLKDEYGILVEMDNLWEEENCIFSKDGYCFVLKDSVSDDNEKITVATRSFIDDFDSLSEAVSKKDWPKVQELADVESFAKYYLISNFSLNPDSFVSSNFSYKADLEDKIHAGPIWDYDLAFGSTIGNENTREFLMNPRTMMSNEDKDGGTFLNKMYRELLEIPEFNELVHKIFREKLDTREEEILERIDSQAEKIREAATKNNEYWERDSFGWSVSYLKQWIIERFACLEEMW